MQRYRVCIYIPLLGTIAVNIKTHFQDESLAIMPEILLPTRNRMIEMKENPSSLSEDAFSGLCKTYSFFLKQNELLEKCKLFCCTYLDFDKAVELTAKLHDKSDSVTVNDATDVLSSENESEEDKEKALVQTSSNRHTRPSVQL